MATSGLSDFEGFSANLQKALLASTRLASQLPAPGELQYQRTLSRPLGRKVDEASKRLLHVASRVLDVAKQQTSGQSKGKQSGRGQELQEDDVLDGYQKRIVDVTDQLLEGIDAVLDEQHARKKATNTIANSEVPIASTSAAPAVRSSSNFRNAGDIRKPQLDFLDATDNSRDAVFTPNLSAKPHALVPLDLAIASTGGSRPFVQNPYIHEIQAALTHPLPVPEGEASSTIEKISNRMHHKAFTYVDSTELLSECLTKLRTASTIAVDLEHHDQHSFRGFTCLIQISTTEEDFIIDPLVPAVRANLYTLNEVLADPSIVKVLHGADYDVQWLQQDFSLYLVNLFDTYHASRALGRFTGHSLASLLKEYTAFTPDKKYQLADWRIRPLTPELLQYARSDTHFLIEIYNALRSRPEMTQAVLDDIRRRSAQTASQSYQHVSYDSEEGLGSGGWRKMAERAGKLQLWGIDNQDSVTSVEGASTSTSAAPAPWTWRDKQGKAKYHAMRALHDWRDQLARQEDVSPGYVLPSRSLLAIAERLPKNLGELTLALGPDMKDYIRARSEQILKQVASGVAQAASEPDTGENAASESTVAGIAQASSGQGVATASALFKEEGASSGQPRISLVSSTSMLFGKSGTASSERPGPSRFAAVMQRVHNDLLAQLQPVSMPALSSGTSDAKTGAGAGSEDRQKRKKERSASPGNQWEKNIVQVSNRPKSEQKKRKKPEEASQVKLETASQNGTSARGFVKPFDYTGVKSILDAPMEEESPKKKAKRQKGEVASGQTSERAPPAFKKPPKSMNQPKAGNKSHTFL